jgi:hypothetical protein
MFITDAVWTPDYRMKNRIPPLPAEHEATGEMEMVEYVANSGAWPFQLKKAVMSNSFRCSRVLQLLGQYEQRDLGGDEFFSLNGMAMYVRK